MSEIKLPFTQNIGMIIAGVIIVVAIGGYVLFFQSQSRLNEQIKETEALRDKTTQSDRSFNEIKAKYDAASMDVKKFQDETQNAQLRIQECQQKLEAAQAKLEAAATTQHPVRQLESGSATTPSTATPTPAPTQPTTPPPATITPTQ